MRKFLWCSAVTIALGGAFWMGRASAADKPQNRFFELRTYTAADGKLDDLRRASAITPASSSKSTA